MADEMEDGDVAAREPTRKELAVRDARREAKRQLDAAFEHVRTALILAECAPFVAEEFYAVQSAYAAVKDARAAVSR